MSDVDVLRAFAQDAADMSDDKDPLAMALRDAADEIERLTAEVERLTAENQRYTPVQAWVNIDHDICLTPGWYETSVRLDLFDGGYRLVQLFERDAALAEEGTDG